MKSKVRKDSTHSATVHRLQLLKVLSGSATHSFFRCKEEVHEMKDREIEKVLGAKYQMIPHYLDESNSSVMLRRDCSQF